MSTCFRPSVRPSRKHFSRSMMVSELLCRRLAKWVCCSSTKVPRWTVIITALVFSWKVCCQRLWQSAAAIQVGSAAGRRAIAHCSKYCRVRYRRRKHFAFNQPNTWPQQPGFKSGGLGLRHLEGATLPRQEVRHRLRALTQHFIDRRMETPSAAVVDQNGGQLNTLITNCLYCKIAVVTDLVLKYFLGVQ